jgi:hypothetical protein
MKTTNPYIAAADSAGTDAAGVAPSDKPVTEDGNG